MADKKAAKTVKRLYIVRHGQSALNVQRIYAGQIDTPLTEQGKEEARDAGVAARELAIDYVLSSPLGRAQDTAKIIAGRIGFPLEDIVLDERLMERHYGHFQGLSWDIALDDSDDIETIEAVLARAKAVLEAVQQLEAENVLLVSHGTFAKVMREAIHPKAKVEYQDISQEMKNGEVFRLI